MFPMVLTPFLFDIFAHGAVSFVKKTVKNEEFLTLPKQCEMPTTLVVWM